jgi:hypothetical protein
MPFVERDEMGRIVAVSQVPGSDLEALPADHPELQAFLGQLGEEAHQLSATDQDFVRVLEDVVELLVSKGVILFTELPPSAQEKMLHRQRLRTGLAANLDLIGDD